MKTPKRITLANDVVTLIPMTMDYVNEFYEAGKDSEVWRWAPPYQCESLNTAKQWVASSLNEVANGQQVMFGIIDNASGRFVGSTRFCSIDLVNSGIEIGFTFIHPDFQRTYINSNAKLLLLTHAFEALKAVRVQLRTHEDNQKSRRAISRLGATFEGILRSHRLLSTGEYRNTALFSVLTHEWPEVKERLQRRAESHVNAYVNSTVSMDSDVVNLITEFPLAQVIVTNGEGSPASVIYVPLRFDVTKNTLTGHVSVSNKILPLIHENTNVIVTFQGDDAYISPSLHEQIKVPTWIYRRVDVTGSCRLLPMENNREQIGLQVKEFEGDKWSMDDQPEALINNMLKNIRCFEIVMNNVKKQFKVEDGKPTVVKTAIKKHLIASGKLALANCFK